MRQKLLNFLECMAKAMLDAKARMIEQLVGKLQKRCVELEKDIARLGLVNKSAAAGAIRSAVDNLRLAIADLGN